MADTNSKEIKTTTTATEAEEELKAFNADVKLSQYAARIANGELSPAEKATLNALKPGSVK